LQKQLSKIKFLVSIANLRQKIGDLCVSVIMTHFTALAVQFLWQNVRHFSLWCIICNEVK